MRYKKKHVRADGFRSKLESEVSKVLEGKGLKVSFETEKLTYLLPKRYIPDFVVEYKGKKIYLEVKGYLRFEDQQKMRAVKATNPELDIRFYFPRDQRVHTSKMLNSQWATKYNFPYYIGSLPKDWYKK